VDRLRPTQIAALIAAAADPQQMLRRGPGGYASADGQGIAASLHSSRAVYALEREGLLEYVEVGLPSVARLTDNGRRALEEISRQIKQAAA
jgi:hypothetical protein